MSPNDVARRRRVRTHSWVLASLAVTLVTIAMVTVSEADDSLTAIETVRRVYAGWTAEARCGGGVILEYATEAVAWDTTRGVGTSNVWQAASKEVSLVVSDEATVCFDSTVLVAVFPSRHEILITDARGRVKPTQAADPMAVVRDSLLRASTVIRDQRIEGERGEALRTITLDVDQARTPGHRIDSMTITFDPGTNMVRQYDLAMTRDHPLRRVSVHWKHAIADTLSPDLPSSPMALIYDGSSRLLPRYSGYTVRDVRVSRP